MKKLITILLLMIGVTASAQYTPFNYNQYKGTKVDSTSLIPTFCGTPVIRNTVKNQGALAIDSCNKRLYFYDPKDSSWNIVTAGSEGTLVIQNSAYVDSFFQGGNFLGAIYHSDGLIKGGSITPIDSTRFTVEAAVYSIEGTIYFSRDTVILLPSAGDTARIDAIIVTLLSQTNQITGVESEFPALPTVNPTSQVALGFVFVSLDTVTVSGPPSTFTWDQVMAKDSISTHNAKLVNLSPAPATGNTPISPSLAFIANGRDTIAATSRQARFDIKLLTTRGGATPVNNLVIQNGALLPLNLSNTANGIFLTGTNTISTSSSATPLTLAHASSTARVDLVGTSAPLSANGYSLRIATGAATGGSLSKAITTTGDASLPLLNAYAYQGISVSNSNPSIHAIADFNDVWGGIIMPCMTTVQRNGIVKRIATLTLTNAGSGYTLNRPAVTAGGSTGKQARISVAYNPSLGTVTGLTLDYGGTDYPTGGSLSFNNTGTGGTGAAGTFTVTTDTIPFGMAIINRDSLSSPLEIWNGSTWLSLPGTGSGGSFTLTNGNGTTAAGTAVNLGGTLTGNVAINDNVANTHDFSIGTGTAIKDFTIVAEGAIDISSPTSGTTIVSPGIQLNAAGGVLILNGDQTFMQTLIGQHNSDDSMLVRKTSNGEIGYRPIPSGGGSGGPDSVIAVHSPLVATVSNDTVHIGMVYYLWRGLISQSGTSAPTAQVLKGNSLGTIVWSYNATGDYTGTLSGAFPEDKVLINGVTVMGVATKGGVIIIQNDDGSPAGSLLFKRIDDDNIQMRTFDSTAAASDDVIQKLGITIEVDTP